MNIPLQPIEQGQLQKKKKRKRKKKEEMKQITEQMMGQETEKGDGFMKSELLYSNKKKKNFSKSYKNASLKIEKLLLNILN